MLSNEIIYRALDLLNKGVSQREIAQFLGISNTMVSLIHQKKRKPFATPTNDLFIQPEGPYVRCPKCGGKSQSPCLYCQIRDYLKKNRVKSLQTEMSGGNIEIELTGEYARRYREVHEWRMRQPNPHFREVPENWPWKNEELTRKRAKVKG